MLSVFPISVKVIIEALCGLLSFEMGSSAHVAHHSATPESRRNPVLDYTTAE